MSDCNCEWCLKTERIVADNGDTAYLYLSDRAPVKFIVNKKEVSGYFHRHGGPACISKNYASYYEEWFVEGKRHNESGPAQILVHNEEGEQVKHVTFNLNGVPYSFEQWLEQIPYENKIKALYHLDGDWEIFDDWKSFVKKI